MKESSELAHFLMMLPVTYLWALVQFHFCQSTGNSHKEKLQQNRFPTFPPAWFSTCWLVSASWPQTLWILSTKQDWFALDSLPESTLCGFACEMQLH